MIAFQLDTVDVFARNMRPYVVRIAESMKNELSPAEQLDMETVLQFYRTFDGDMTEDSVAGSVHMHYLLAFHKSLFHKQEPDSEEERLLISDNYAFMQMYQRLLVEVDD